MTDFETRVSTRPTMVAAASPGQGRRQHTQLTGFPPELLSQSAAAASDRRAPLRLRVLHEQPAAGHAVSGGPGAVLLECAAAGRRRPSRSPRRLSFAALTWSPRIPVATIPRRRARVRGHRQLRDRRGAVLDVGIWARQPPWAGLSWVAVWMLGFTVIVPTPPRWALARRVSPRPARCRSSSATSCSTEPSAPSRSRRSRFFFRVVLPYLLVVLVGYVSARLIYRLGSELKRAQGARQLPAGRAAGRGRHGRGLARAASPARAARRDQADASRSARRLARRERQSELHARFEREAQATSLLRSPHTIELYDFGVADDGAFYYVMELLDGFDLETLVARFGPLPAERAVHLLTQVCHSLGEAHAAGLIHRDIKPANVYVCRLRPRRRLRESARLRPRQVAARATRADDDRGHDATHVVRGTPAFMSPEQALANRPIDGRSDIYALGCLGYWLVTGELVFAGRTAMETLVHHTQADPAPPSQRTELPIPEAFDRLILDCLPEEPGRSAGERRCRRRSACRDHHRGQLDAGARPGVVESAPPGRLLKNPAT